MYADDILLYKPICSRDGYTDFQSDLDSVCTWVSSAGLRLNPSKTKFMLVSRKKTPTRPLPLSANGSPVAQVDSFTYLRVIIQSNLSWTSHVDKACSKAKQQLGLIYRHFHPAGLSCIAQLFKSTVRHWITAPVFGTRITVPLLTRLKGFRSLQQELPPGTGLVTMRICAHSWVGLHLLPDVFGRNYFCVAVFCQETQ